MTTFNLPSERILTLLQGAWEQLSYPTAAKVIVQLEPADYFGAAINAARRSHVPEGTTGFSLLLDANCGAMLLQGEGALPEAAVRFVIAGSNHAIRFTGNRMEVTTELTSPTEIDSLLTNAEFIFPQLLSVATCLAIVPSRIELEMGESLRARVETTIPPVSIPVYSEAQRTQQLKEGIALFGIAAHSARFALAAGYQREALYLSASYYDHSPYTLALLAIVRCAQAVEILLGSTRDAIRERAKQLKLPQSLVENDLIRIGLVRNKLGAAHPSAFLPTPTEARVLREFAQRAVRTMREVLLHIANADPADRSFLKGKAERDDEKVELLAALEETLQHEEWSSNVCPIDRRTFPVDDPRLR